MSGSDPRIAPLPIGEWSEEAVDAVRAAFGDAAADSLRSSASDAPRAPNVLTTLMRHPALTGPFLAYNTVLLNAPVLERRHRELMILRVAWRTRSPYEWAQHVRMARSCGITAEEIDAVASGATGIWSPLEADLFGATDQLLDHYRIDDDAWDRLAEHLDERQLMEITFIVGTYACLAMAFNSFGLELDPELEAITPLPSDPLK